VNQTLVKNGNRRGLNNTSHLVMAARQFWSRPAVLGSSRCGIGLGTTLFEFTIRIWLFAECHILCRMFFRSLGKEALCRVLRKKPSVKENTRRRSSLLSVLFLTLGKEFLCRVSFLHSAKGSLPSVTNTTLGEELFAECHKYNTRRRAL
jgi:hypothetical protein